MLAVWLRAWITNRVVWARERFDARADVTKGAPATTPARRLRHEKKDRRLVFDLLRFVIDAIAAVSGLTLIVIGLGYVAVIARFLWDEVRGMRDPEPVELPDSELPHVLLQIPVYQRTAW